MIYFKKKPKVNDADDDDVAYEEPKERKVTFTIYNEYGTKQFEHIFTELSHHMDAADQLVYHLHDKYPRLYNECKANRYNWQYQRTSVPATRLDTERRYNYYLTDFNWDPIGL